jgi:N-acyl-D-amino-acid deacylase
MRARLVVVVLAVYAGSALGEDKKPTVPLSGTADPRFALLDEIMTTVIDKQSLAGASLAVLKDGKLVYSRGFGYADRENMQPMPPNALFRLCSVSKALTAVAILKLIEQGKFELDSSVTRLLDLHPTGRKADERWHKITIRHLLEHRGGWDVKASKFDPMFAPGPIVREMRVFPPVLPHTIIQYMLRQPLDFEPGSKFAYNNFGYCLLGRVIEKVSKQKSYEKFVQQEVLKPLGITRMRLGRSLLSQRFADEVRYHSPVTANAVVGSPIGRSVSAPYGGFYLEAMDAHGGWLGSAADLARFAQAFDDPQACKILKPESVQQLFQSSNREESKGGAYYARGWLVQPLGKEQIVYWHDGAMEGSASMVVRRPDGITFAVLFNARGKEGDPEPIALVNGPLHQAVSRIFAAK